MTKRMGAVLMVLALVSLVVSALGAGPVAAADPLKELGLLLPPKHMDTPPFSLPNLKGGNLSLKDLRGKIVFLNFWATWCVPCREEMPAMERLWKAMDKSRFAMVGISVDIQGEKVVAPFVKELGLTFTILMDRSRQVQNAYGAHALPTTFILGTHGEILLRALGERKWDSPTAVDLMEVLIEAGPRAGDVLGIKGGH